MKHPPLMIGWQLAGRRALVVGGGRIASARVRALLAAGAVVRVVAPVCLAEIERWHRVEHLILERREAEVSDLEDADLVVIAIDDPDVSSALADAARERRIPVHVADRAELCDFVFPAVHREGRLQVAVSTSGAAPALAGRLRDHLRAATPPGVARALTRFDRLRKRVRAVDGGASPERRMGFLKDLARRTPWVRIASWEESELDARAAEFEGDIGPPSAEVPVGGGELTLVGSGPGAAEHLTLAARRAIEDADLVVADRLVSPELLALVGGELFVARKVFGRADEAQAELEARMEAALRRGLRVARLKIGDPSVFGRAAEELERFEHLGVRVRVLPGVSSVNAAAAAAGISLTRRDVADRIWIGTGRGARGSVPDVPAHDLETTYAFLMAVGRLESLSRELIQRGYPRTTPACLVTEASLDGERILRADLASIARLAREAALEPPGVLFLGDVLCAEPAALKGALA